MTNVARAWRRCEGKEGGMWYAEMKGGRKEKRGGVEKMKARMEEGKLIRKKRIQPRTSQPGARDQRFFWYVTCIFSKNTHCGQCFACLAIY